MNIFGKLQTIFETETFFEIANIFLKVVKILSKNILNNFVNTKYFLKIPNISGNARAILKMTILFKLEHLFQKGNSFESM